MTTELAAILAANRKLFAEIDSREATIRKRETEARREVEACEEAQRQLESERATLRQAEDLYRKAFAGASESAPADVTAPAGATLDDVTTDARLVQKRARIGPQRYLMFMALRTFGKLSAITIAEETHLSVKRIREQMAADARLGTVYDYGGDVFELTKGGHELLIRYEVYKKAMGHTLPTLADVSEASGDEYEDFELDAEPPDSGKLSGAPKANGALPLTT
jgi:hypothetical protein